MQQGTVSSADRLSQGVIAWPQVRQIPMKTSEKSRKNPKIGAVVTELNSDERDREADLLSHGGFC